MKGRGLLVLLSAAWLAGSVTAAPSRCAPVPLGPVRFERIAIWRDDARAAYSIIHDDMCDDGVDGIQDLALPALQRRGLRVGLAPFVQACEHRKKWRAVAKAAAQGHEIVSHSYSHSRITPENAVAELTRAKTIFERRAGRPVEFFVFPFDEFTPATVALVERAGYRGARAGDRNQVNGLDRPPINSPEAEGDFAVMFDVWPHSFSKYSLYKGVDLLNVHVWDAIERGGWAVRELHGVMRDDDAPEKNGFGPIALSTYEKHLDFLVEARRANQVWTDTPSAVLRYRHARRACQARVDGARIEFDASAAECVRFATPISVVVGTRADLPGLRATQKGQRVPVLRLGPDQWSVTADPTRGPVVLAGCAEAVSVGGTTVSLTPRPQPVASICDVETVTSVQARTLENFERKAQTFDAADVPSWSFYPGAAQFTRRSEGATVVGRFSGQVPGNWSGATYLFAGRDGSAVCYDVRAHRGVRFRVRGRVENKDAAPSRIYVSLVTAETRPQAFGGDLKGEGGHFHAVVEVAPEWRTVEIPWSAFQRPSWGATAALEKPALAKLQALDWGIPPTATAFEVDLDDVALY